MALAELLGDLSTAEFLEQHYLKLPFARPGGCRYLLPSLGWPMVERVLSQPDVDVLVGREGQPWSGSSPSSPEAARDVLARGYTVGIRHAEKHDPALADLAAGFQHDFLAPIDIHVYCTPAGCPGFGWHYDAEDVFLLQGHGRKEWSLRKNTVNPWPLVETLPADMRYEREIMPRMTCCLDAGDWLYLPGGYWHRSQAPDESISLSIGIRTPTALDVYDFLRTGLRESLQWRQRLPIAGAASTTPPEELLRQYQALFATLGQDLQRLLSQESTARAFLKTLAQQG
jgi:50S ribosomal protein L16 3-hydroxylase